MPRARFSKEEVEFAKSQLKHYMNLGYKYHDAAKEVEKLCRIPFLSLRYRAYYMYKEVGKYKSTKLQHATHTVHGNLLLKCKEKFEREGYEVIMEQNEVRYFVESMGSTGNPDLIAINEDETLVVEVAEPEKDLRTLVKQVDRYREVGKVIIVFPMDTTNMTLWGMQNL